MSRPSFHGRLLSYVWAYRPFLPVMLAEVLLIILCALQIRVK